MIDGYKIIAVCTAKIHDARCYDFITTLNRQFSGSNCRIIVYNICTDLYWNDEAFNSEASIYSLIDFTKIDTLIYLDEKIKSKAIAEHLISSAKAHKVPVIVVDGEYKDTSCIKFDYKEGFSNILKHIFEHHKLSDAHFIAGIPGNPFSEERLQLFKKFATKYLGTCSDNMISFGYFWDNPTKEAVERLLARRKMPEAIVCANDSMALTVIKHLSKNGVSVPEDVLVTGFDGIDDAFLSVPQLTTAYCDHSIMARKVYSVTKLLLEGKKVKPEYFVEPTMYFTESCGCTESEENQSSAKQKISRKSFDFSEVIRSVFRITEHMQNSNSVETAWRCMNRDPIENACCIINKEFTDRTIKPDTIKIDGYFNKTMCLFFKTQAPATFLPQDFNRDEIIPDFAERLKSGYPIIFNAIDFMNIPIGYMAFYFQNYKIENYLKLPIIITAVKNAIGGYANMQYQHYLLEKMENLYKLDSLTGLYNRQGFNREFEKFTAKMIQTRGVFTVLISDLDSLKSINDRYGHAAGDNAIQKSAQAFKTACPDNALCVRFGGDELLAVIEGDVDTFEIKSKIAKFLDDYNQKSGNPYTVSTSIGVFKTSGDQNIDFETLVKQADRPLYEEKRIKKSSGNLN